LKKIEKTRKFPLVAKSAEKTSRVVIYLKQKFRTELEEALEAAHDRRRIQMLDSVCKEESLLQGNMLLEEEFSKNRKKVEDELTTAKQQSHNAKQEIERLTQLNQVFQADVEK
jgi:hypothetical protein